MLRAAAPLWMLRFCSGKKTKSGEVAMVFSFLTCFVEELYAQ